MAKIAFWFLLLCAPLPFVAILWSRLIALEHYYLLSLLWVALPAFIAIRWDRAVRLPTSRLSRAMIFFGTIAFAYSIWRFSPWVGSFAWLLFLGAFLHSQHCRTSKPRINNRSRADGSLIHLWPLALLLIPLPMNLDQRLMAWVNVTSMSISSYVMDFQAIPHRAFGDIIEIGGDFKLNIQSICGGALSVFALAMAAGVMVVYIRRSFWLFPLYFVAAVFWAVTMNVLRIVLAVDMHARFGWTWTEGWQQLLLATVSFAVAMLFLASSDRLIQVFFFPIKPDELAENPNPLLSFWNRVNGY